MAEVTVTKENFEEEVIKSELPVLIDFWASWCGPCRMLAPIVEEIANERTGKLKVCKINVDEQPELADAFHVSSIPLLVYMKGGKVINTALGYRSKEAVEQILD